LGNAAQPDDCAVCPGCGARYERRDGIWRLLPPERAAFFAPFLRDYTQIRDAEGYGYDDDERYRRLPEVDPSDPLAWQWRMRAITFAELRRRVLEPMSRECERDTRQGGGQTRRQGAGEQLSRPLRVLDMGSGVGWLSHRLARLGHAPCAVDLNLDPRDGLGAAAHYPASWPLLQAEFDHLPLAEAQADVVVFNAALPYSADYRATLAEALRVLRPGGRLVVMDSPIYRRDASGRQMVAERQAAFERAHGTRSDAVPSVGYLTWGMLADLGRDLGLRWRSHIPWYGWRWALRPWRARLLRQREPSTFALLVAERG
jgi:SAM-dependent methyltransferase